MKIHFHQLPAGHAAHESHENVELVLSGMKYNK
jgi:hypothetical protein